MADLTITAGSVIAADGAVSKAEFIAGEPITAGQVFYIDTAAGSVAKLARADGTNAEATLKGIALNSAAAGQPVMGAIAGSLDAGATLTVGMVYCVSATPGGICPYADLVSGDYVSIVGVATEADALTLVSFNSGAEKP